MTTASSSGADHGWWLQIGDGGGRSRLWMRSSGLNIEGGPDVPYDMAVWRDVRIETFRGTITITVDGRLAQSGPIGLYLSSASIMMGTEDLSGGGTATHFVDRIRAARGLSHPR